MPRFGIYPGSREVMPPGRWPTSSGGALPQLQDHLANVILLDACLHAETLGGLTDCGVEERREQDDGLIRLLPKDRLGCFKPTGAGHALVEQHYVGPVLPPAAQRLVAVGCHPGH